LKVKRGLAGPLSFRLLSAVLITAFAALSLTIKQPRNFSTKVVSNNSETFARRIGGPPRTLRRSATEPGLPRHLLSLLQFVNLPLAEHPLKKCQAGYV